MINKTETNVTMVFLPVSNFAGINRDKLREFNTSNKEELDELLKLLGIIKSYLILKDWGVHDIDEDGDIVVPQMDADIFNDLDDCWEEVVVEDDLKSFADVMEMDIEDFEVWMKEYWAIALPLSISSLKRKLAKYHREHIAEMVKETENNN